MCLTLNECKAVLRQDTRQQRTGGVGAWGCAGGSAVLGANRGVGRRNGASAVLGGQQVRAGKGNAGALEAARGGEGGILAVYKRV